MQQLLTELQNRLPWVLFEAGDAFYWSPQHSKVVYNQTPSPTNWSSWSLLHEAAHALLGHQAYTYDLELVLLEVEAWDKAKQLGEEFDITIEDDHIQDCLDTYRDWLHQRSTCPRCGTVSLQTASSQYRCHNCLAEWNVSASRFCRPYRLSGRQIKKSPKVIPQATFQ